MPEEPASDPFATEKYAKVKQDAAESKAKEDALDAATERRWRLSSPDARPPLTRNGL
jgi:hypothetical protein